MKLVFALALLVASVTVFSGTSEALPKHLFTAKTELADKDDDNIKESFFTRIAQRVRAIAENVLVAIKAKLAESKELFGEFKERLDEVTAELAELGKHTGKKALEAARALRDKVGELNKAIVKRIKDKISGSLYTEADKEEDQSIQQLIEKQLRQLAERIRSVVQRVLDTLKEKLGESKELVAKFGERIEAIKAGLAELTKKSAQQAIRAVGELRRKVLDLAREIKKTVTGEDFFYEAALYDGAYDDAMIERIKVRIAKHIKEVLDRVEASIPEKGGTLPDTASTLLKTKFTDIWDKIDDLKKDIKPLEDNEDGLFKKEGGAADFTKIVAIREKLTNLVDQVRQALKPDEVSGSYSILYAGYDLRDALIAIRDIVTQPAGLQKLKAYLNNLETSHPTVALVRAYVEASSDDALIELLKEFFSGFDGINLADFPITDLAELFGTVRDEILTDAGIQKLREYARNIQSSHPVVSKIKTALETRPTDAIRAFLKELFSGLDF